MSELISLVVSVYNEEAGLQSFFAAARNVLEKFCKEGPYDYELCFVNDGSTDKSGEVLKKLREEDPRHVTIISFSRNFGHEAAMAAGLDTACGDYLIFMDADLQHPPQAIPDIMAAFKNGAGVVSMVRTGNETAGSVKNITSGLFYRLINSISDTAMAPGASDFFALTKKSAAVLRNNYREKVRFIRGYVQNIGFNRAEISYEAEARVAGKSHYSIKRLWKLSTDTIISFSDVPLKLGIYAGFLSGFVGVVLIIYTLLTRKGAPGGYTTIVIVLCFMFAVLFMLLGIMGCYMAIMFKEMQDRPIYIIENIERADAAGNRS